MDWPVNNEANQRSIAELFESGKWWVYRGKTLEQFQKRFAEAHDCSFGVGVCNGTVPLDIVLRCFEIGAGDKVVLPAYDYFCLPKSVLNAGAQPVFVDVYKDNLTIDADQVREAVKDPAVKAVVAVHIDGCVANVDELSQICRDAGVRLIEDCAQASGAIYDGRRVGSWGDAGMFSFGGVKLMTCGQGGMITTSDEETFKRCFAIANRGYLPGGTLNSDGIVGGNYGMSELSAAVLIPQLEMLEELGALRESWMRELDQVVAETDGLEPLKQFPKTERRAQFRYSFLYDNRIFGLKPAELAAEARKAGIPVSPTFRSAPDDPMLAGLFASCGDFPVARAAQDSVISIRHIEIVTKGVDFWKDAIRRLPLVARAAEKVCDA
jgi:dTDP-4-amino-4,6-dideoxygalactose transaminase